MVERNLAKVEVDGSNPFSRSNSEKREAVTLPFFVGAAVRRHEQLALACDAAAQGPDGEIGRHCGLKIRRFRTGACRFDPGSGHHELCAATF